MYEPRCRLSGRMPRSLDHLVRTSVPLYSLNHHGHHHYYRHRSPPGVVLTSTSNVIIVTDPIVPSLHAYMYIRRNYEATNDAHKNIAHYRRAAASHMHTHTVTGGAS